MQYCVLRNKCDNPDLCCYYCDNKKCEVRCLDNKTTCKFSIEEPRQWYKPWNIIKESKKEHVFELPKTLSPFSNIIKKYNKEKVKLENGGFLTTHYIRLKAGLRTKDGKYEISDSNLLNIASQLRKVK